MPYEITIFAMMEDGENSFTLSDSPENTKFYDVMVRDPDGEIIKESEDIKSYSEASATAQLYAALYPDSEIQDIGG